MAYKKVVLEGDATVDIFAANSIQLSSENFADNDTSLMTSAAINDRIAAISSNTSGTVTSVGGTGTVSGISLSGTVTSSGNLSLGGTLAVAAGSLDTSNDVGEGTDDYVLSWDNANSTMVWAAQSVDLSNLPDMTGGWTNSQDEFVVLDNGTQKRKLSSEIFGSNAFNSTAFTTNTGTVTSVATGSGLTGGAITSTGTISVDFSGLSDISSGGSFQTGDAVNGDADGIIVSDDGAAVPKIAYFQDIPLSFFNNDAGFTSNSGDITQVQLVADSGNLTDSSGNVSFTIAGGTGLSSSATGSTLTINAAQDISTSADVEFANLTLSGDLTVSGQTITTATETLEVADNTIILNSDLGSNPAVDAGFVFERGTDGNNRTMFYDESADRFVTSLNSSAALGGTYQADIAQVEVNGSFSNSSTKVPVGHFQWNGSNLYVRTS
jgi:hypothetical protein